MIQSEQHGTVTVLRMEHGKVNAMDVELLSELMEKLEEAERSSATAIVFTGTVKAFSAGVDLFRVLNEGKQYLQKFLPLLKNCFEKIFLFPKPVVSAVNGPAIAGGCILTCASDYRIAVKGSGSIGVSELLVGVPFPPLALEIVRFAVSQHHLQEIVYSGKYFAMDQALEYGLIDELVAGENLIDRAKEVATRYGAIPPSAFQITKTQLRQPYIDCANRFGVSDQEILEEWSAPATHAVIREYLEKTIGKK